ncbi:DUF2510 domain-containing protein [Candidatus Poriferisocius sp.]|uniref:DUF2510 domain-containing protein n=1 Tax=Candidatus Poriferisocius sp. TaxID=3101276 RepID=UPI003B0216CA
MLAVALVASAGVEAASQSPSHAAPEPATAVAVRCFGHHGFGEYPVDVAKAADGETVLAQTSWNWHDTIGCYLTLDDDALAVLRAAPVPQDLPAAPTDASRRCFEYHKFGEYPVDVAKTFDRETVIARLSWGYHDSIGCYLVLDDEALAALRAAAMAPLPDPGWYPDPTCRHEQRTWDGQAWTEQVWDQGVRSTDSIRPGEADTLAQPGEAFACSLSDPVMAVEGWKPDPTCRYDFRWWENGQWMVNAVNSGEDAEQDFLLVSDGYLPLPGPPVACPNLVAASFAFPCDNPAPSDEPGVGIGDDGLPCATRLPELGDPMFMASGSRSDPPGLWLRYEKDSYYYKPERVSDKEALGYITACLRGGAVSGGGDAYPDSYPTYANGPTPPDGWHWSQPGDYLSVYQECADNWSRSAHAINFGGMGSNLTCVYDAYLDFHLRTPDSVRYGLYESGSWYVGWAEACGSWLDPVPDRSFVEKCVWLRGYYIGHNEALHREAIDSNCANIHRVIGYTLEVIERIGICAHRYMLLAMVLRWIRSEALRLGLEMPPDEYLPDYRARPLVLTAC